MEKLRQFLANLAFDAESFAAALVDKTPEQLQQLKAQVSTFKKTLVADAQNASTADAREEHLTLTRNAKSYFEAIVAEEARRTEVAEAEAAEKEAFEAQVAELANDIADETDTEEVEETPEEEVEESASDEAAPVTASLDEILKEAPEKMVASAKKPEKAADPLVITASGGRDGSTPEGYAEGQTMSLTAAGAAMAQKLKTIPINNERRDFVFMDYKAGMPQMAKADPGQNMLDIEKYALGRADQALTAAGCPPYPLRSDQYQLSFCNDTYLDYADFVGAPRGGFQYYPFEGIAELATADVNNAIGTEWDGVSLKECLLIDCLPAQDCIVEAFPTCLLIPNDLDRFAPERRDKVIRDAMQLHKERVAEAHWQQVLDEIALDANHEYTYTPPDACGSVIASVNAAIAHLVSKIRGTERKCDSPVLIFAQQWLFDDAWADHGFRTFADFTESRDDLINYWRKNNVVIRSIGHWDPLVVTDTSFPTSIDLVGYLPGAYIIGDGGTLDLGVSRGPSTNVQNLAQLFLEQWLCLSRVGPRGHRVTVDASPLGNTGAANVTCAAAE